MGVPSAPSATPPLTEKDLGHWRLLQSFRQHLAAALKNDPLPASWADPQRTLAAPDYLSLYLFGLLNPVTQTLRGLSAASRLERVQKEVCTRVVPRATFSDAQHLLDPALLEKVFAALSAPIPSAPGETRPGRDCERKVWQEQWEKGAAYVGDRLYAQHYALLPQLEAKGCAYVLRLRAAAVLSDAQEWPVDAADRAAGVTRQAWAQLGQHGARVRVVWIAGEKEELLLVTNLAPETLSAALVSQLYRQRWKIELFFRWVKQNLKIKKFLGASENAIRIQIAVALIAYLLLRLAHAAQKSGLTLLAFTRLVRVNLMHLKRIDRLLEDTAETQFDDRQMAFRCF